MNIDKKQRKNSKKQNERLSTKIQRVTLNISGLNTSNKTHFKCNGKGKQKIKIWEKVTLYRVNQMKAKYLF